MTGENPDGKFTRCSGETETRKIVWLWAIPNWMYDVLAVDSVVRGGGGLDSWGLKILSC